jgi:hypothetical protein
MGLSNHSTEMGVNGAIASKLASQALNVRVILILQGAAIRK